MSAVPVADTVKIAVSPVQTVLLKGCIVIAGETAAAQPGGITAVIAEVLKAPVVVRALPSITAPVFKFMAPLLHIIVPTNSE